MLRAATPCTFSFPQLLKAEGVCTFWLWDVLRATTACNFSSHLTRCLHTCRFSEPTFQPSRATNHSGSRLSYLFAHLDLLSSDSFSSLIFSLLVFSSLTLPTSAFPSVHILSEVWCLNFLRSVRFKRKINWKYINWFQLKPFLILRFKRSITWK